jgi:SAM-dependent methyltransferase
MVRSRRAKIGHFYSLFEPGMSVLDVGVTGLDDPAESGPQNFLLRTYPYAPESYTGLGVQDLAALQRAHPGKRFVYYDGTIFPFRDDAFDWVFCNAVIEHVGDAAAQRLFLSEMLRVGRYVFFTTPNRHFPIETHTYLPFIHWNQRLFDKWLWRYRPKWRREKSIWLLSAADLRRLLNETSAGAYSIQKNRLMLWPMTFTVVASMQSELPSPRAADALGTA